MARSGKQFKGGNRHPFRGGSNDPTSGGNQDPNNPRARKRGDTKEFTKTASKIHPENRRVPMRGGIRL